MMQTEITVICRTQYVAVAKSWLTNVLVKKLKIFNML